MLCVRRPGRRVGRGFRPTPGRGPGPRRRGRARGQQQDFALELAGFVADAQPVADAEKAGGFRTLAVDFDAADVAGAGGELAGFEEAGGPEPLVEAQGGCVVGGGHTGYFRADLDSGDNGMDHGDGWLQERSFRFAEDDNFVRSSGVEGEVVIASLARRLAGFGGGERLAGEEKMARSQHQHRLRVLKQEPALASPRKNASLPGMHESPVPEAVCLQVARAVLV